MKIVVVGAGVIGATSAYWLSRAGHDVLVLDAANGPGLGVSAGNGAQLAYAYVDPMAGPEIWAGLPGILLGRHNSTRIKLSLDPKLAAWGLQFLWQCRPSKSDAPLRELLALSRTSRDEMDRLLSEEHLEFGHRQAGKLILFRDKAGLDRAARSAALKREFGFSIDVLDEAACRAIEPALGRYPFALAGGIFASQDAVGDCGAFVREIVRIGRKRHGLRIETDTIATAFLGAPARINGVATNRGDIAADAVVLAAGPQSRALAQTAGVRLPLFPVKGYSLTAPAGTSAPNVSLTDREARVLIARIGDRVRIAAYADLDGWGEVPNPARASALMRTARALYPDAARWDEADPVWMGRRPMTPDGRPIIGPSSLPGLFLNVGHGGLGWTLACGSAARLSRIIGPA
jgi:D-amino-acid dehydrogenase